MAEYREMLARDAAGNPPEVRAKEVALRARLLARLAELRGGRMAGLLIDESKGANP